MIQAIGRRAKGWSSDPDLDESIESRRIDAVQVADHRIPPIGTGRALPASRIVSRIAPFAKAFTSSCEIKCSVGLAAWATLEDIARNATLKDDARLVVNGWLVVATNVRLNPNPS